MRIIATIPELAGRNLDGVQIEPLTSLTNRTCRVSTGSEDLVVRIAGRGTERYIDRRSEAQNTALAASIGVAPEVVHCDTAAGLMVTRLIAGGHSLDAAELREPETLIRSAGLLRRLHGSGLRFAGEMRLFPKLDQYMELTADNVLLREFGLIDLRRQADKVRRVLEARPVALVPSHVDPVPDNFVAVGQRLYLVDWEYSAMAEPAWDLAGLALEAALDSDQEQLLLQTYFEVDRATEAARFLLHKSALLLVAAAWAVLQIVDGNTNGDFAAYARDRLDRYRWMTEDAAHVRALAELAR